MKTASSSLRHVDLSYLEKSALGNPTFVPCMLELLSQQWPRQIDQLLAACATADGTRIRFCAHKLKSPARMLGLHDAEPLLVALEDLPTDEPSTLDRLTAQIRTLGVAVLDDLQTLQHQPTA